jgi:hypothetical protein
MLEVCFSDSSKGSLTFAQHCGNDVIGSAIGFITDKKGLSAFFAKKKALKEYKKRQIELQKQAVSLDGKREDIVGVSFGLSEGDIKSPICLKDCPRKEYIRSMFSFDRYNKQEDMETSINEFWTNCIEDLEKLKSNPQKIRVWLDHTPDAQCGLLFIADLLKDSKTEIHVVELPQRITREDNCIVEYRGWGEVEPQLYGTFLDRERVLAEKEIADLADQWQLLKTENSPLRVVENGIVKSTQIDYYDDLIRKEFPKSTCKIAEIIGSTLGKQRVLTGDVFLAKRIQDFIKSGELKIVGNQNNGFYGTVVSCAK